MDNRVKQPIGGKPVKVEGRRPVKTSQNAKSEYPAMSISLVRRGTFARVVR